MTVLSIEDFLGREAGAELDHIEQCPVCGQAIDFRDLDQVNEHLHEAELPVQFDPKP